MKRAGRRDQFSHKACVPMKRRRGKKSAQNMVLSADPQRVRIRELREALDARRDAIAEADLEIETLRDELVDFELRMDEALGREHETLRRIESHVRHVSRWSELLRSATVEELEREHRRIDERRDRELRRASKHSSHHETMGSSNPTPPSEPQPEKNQASLDRDRQKRSPPTDALKAAYRRLARRFHPDLARSEDERLESSRMMVRINSLYRDGELERLASLAEQAKGGELDDNERELDVDEQLDTLEERLQWFDAVLDNLRDERNEIENSPTCELMRTVGQTASAARHLIEKLRDELQARIASSYSQIVEAIHGLENDVSDYNRRRTHLSDTALARRERHDLERRFDAFAHKSLIRASLAAITTQQVSPAAQTLSERLEAWAKDRPELLDLALFTYASELTPFPLEGLETFDGLEIRYNALARGHRRPELSQSLVEIDEILEFGVRKATERVAHLGLRFRHDIHREAILVALQSLHVRSALRGVLAVLGNHGVCDNCHRTVFFSPVFKLRGLDDLRAQVCPSCGHSQSRYWLPRGEDVQTVLNPTYLDLELLQEWSFQIAHQTVATQLVPIEVEMLNVGALKRRITEDILWRHQIEVSPGQIELWQGQVRLGETTKLHTLTDTNFILRFSDELDWSERDAVELIRHRVRNRFRTGEK